MAVSSVSVPPPNLGPAPAVPAGNFTKIANSIVTPPPHKLPPVQTAGAHHQSAPPVGPGTGAKSHKVDHAV